MEIDEIIRKIESKLESKIILFTGAGFSLDCQDVAGNKLPSGNQLAEEIWSLIESLIRQPYDGSALRETFGLAQRKKPKELQQFLQNRFSINHHTIPDYYKRYIEFPWTKAYTLNIDDIFDKLQIKFSPKIRVKTISATTLNESSASYINLPVYHLHGKLDDKIEDLIFSTDDYATHQGLGHPYYKIMASELNESMFIFIGSELDEEILWKHIVLRDLKTRNNRELRPESFLITPSLKEAKKQLLRERNITHIAMTAKEFSEKILSKIESKYNQIIYQKINQLTEIKKNINIPLVQDLIAKREDLTKRRHILLGFKPIWKDILDNKTIERDPEIALYNLIIKDIQEPLLEKEPAKIYLLTGTAGDGKSTSLMRLAVKLSKEGVIVGYLDPDSTFFWKHLKNTVEATDKLEVLIIDDVHVYKENFILYINEILELNKLSAILISCRSNRVDTIFRNKNQLNTKVLEYKTQRLADNEINNLLDLLEKEDMLGFLKAKPTSERFQIIKSKNQLDRQLIVTLIEATSGKDFKKYIKDEFSDLSDLNKLIYGQIAVANKFGAKLSSSEISIALDNSTLEFLNSVSEMVQRGLLIKSSGDFFTLRHRTIAYNVYERIVEEGNVHKYFENICRMSAVITYDKSLSKNKRLRNLVKICLGHDILISVTNKSLEKVNEFYDNLKEFFRNDHHYWLQRAAVEIEIGDLAFAQSHISNAIALSPDDPLVIITMHHIELKQELHQPFSIESKEKFSMAITQVKNLIESKSDIGPKPYHIIGFQTLSWVQRKSTTKDEKRELLYAIKSTVEDGVRIYPDDTMLKDLANDIQRTLLMLTTNEK
ncbi:SIR2 family protein [Leptospira mtsangambouensis]|uniref:P-loop NTPase n=1 Tax=Leptospira mtsangambouensis TaxID=2484912 RepID=UPI001EEA3693|nr:SIR2 family protein [Leptospira mtsangambouensis]MCG6140660.1 SIR2 family protein [Leptospira mtsangambouensis]